MKIRIFPRRDPADLSAAETLAAWLIEPGVKNVMVAGGNTPLPLYDQISRRRLNLRHLNVFVLDEYVGVPVNDQRTCSNLLKRTVAEAWDVAPERFFSLDPRPKTALAAVTAHEAEIARQGGLDAIVLGLGQNGHLGFNEPGSTRDSEARVIDLDPGSTEANRNWFAGDHAPAQGATVGLKTILAARRVIILAYGAAKATAVKNVIEGRVGSDCPASFLRAHPHCCLFLDRDAGAGSNRIDPSEPDFQEIPLSSL